MLPKKQRTPQQRAWLKVKQRSPLGIGETRSTLKGRRDRCEAERQHLIREKCVERDGDCRIATDRFRNGLSAEKARADCQGRSEWAHLGEKKRFKTRGMDPEERHTMEGSVMLCTRHHMAYDAGTLSITSTDPAKGADGPLVYRGSPAPTPRRKAEMAAVVVYRTGDVVTNFGSVHGVPVIIRRTRNHRNQMKCPYCGRTKKGLITALKAHFENCVTRAQKEG